MAELTSRFREKLSEPNFPHLATLGRTAHHVSPVRIDVEGDRILVNTSAGRVRERNIRRDPRFALSIVEGGDPYEKVDIRGRVVEGEEADEHIPALTRKYDDTAEPYPLKPGEQRLVLHLEPTVVAGPR